MRNGAQEHAMSRICCLKPANANGPTPEQSDTAINLAGEILLDLDQEGAARGVPGSLVRECLFFSLIPSLMDEAHGYRTADDLTEAVRRAAESWAELREDSRLRTPAL